MLRHLTNNNSQEQKQIKNKKYKFKSKTPFKSENNSVIGKQSGIQYALDHTHRQTYSHGLKL